jgi:hypothetical protein
MPGRTLKLLLGAIALAALGICVRLEPATDADARAGATAPAEGRNPVPAARSVAADLAAPPEAPENGPGTDVAITVVDDEQRPVPHARVVLFRGESVLAELHTTSAGTLRIRAEHARCDAAVWAPGELPPQLLTLDALADPVLRASNGVVVAGRVLIAGAPPSEPLELRIGHDKLPDSLEWPPAVAEALLTSRPPKEAQRCRTESDGSFRFAGLPPWWSGTVSWPRQWCREGARYDEQEHAWIELDQARDDLVLRLVVGDVVAVARVVDTAGTPLRNVSVQVYGHECTTCAGVTDGDGIVEFQLRRPLGPGLAFLIYRELNGKVGTELIERIPPIPPGLKWNVGDLVVPGVPELLISAIDVLGTPIPGASAYVTLRPRGKPEQRRLARTTDELGRTSLPVTDDVVRLSIETPEHLPAFVNPPFDLSRELVVVLRRAASATLSCDLRPESARGHVSVALVPDESPVPAGPADAGETDWRVLERAHRVGLGRVELAQVAPDVPLELRVYDGAGRVIHAQRVAPIPAGEHRDIALALDWTPVAFYLRVKDPDGAGVHRAEILVDGRRVGRTDVVGEAELQGVAPGAVELLLRHPDYAERREPDFVIPPDGAWVKLRMERPARQD